MNKKKFPGEKSPTLGSQFPAVAPPKQRRKSTTITLPLQTWWNKQVAAGHDMNSFPAIIIANDTAGNRTAVINAVSEGGNARGANAVDLQSNRMIPPKAYLVASGDYSAIGGGKGNEASGENSVVGGGNSNTASGKCTFVGSGEDNQATGEYAVACGGYGNVASGYASSIGGGYYNTASGEYSTISGGYDNTASGAYSTVPGGDGNEAAGDYSLAAGSNMHLSATADKSFLFGYSALTTTYTQANAFITHGLRPFFSAPSTAPTDGDITNGQISLWLDEAGNALTFRVKYSGGTLKTGTVALI